MGTPMLAANLPIRLPMLPFKVAVQLSMLPRAQALFMGSRMFVIELIVNIAVLFIELVVQLVMGVFPAVIAAMSHGWRGRGDQRYRAEGTKKNIRFTHQVLHRRGTDLPIRY